MRVGWKLLQALELGCRLLSLSHHAELPGLILSDHDIIHDAEKTVTRSDYVAFASSSSKRVELLRLIAFLGLGLGSMIWFK